MLMQQDWLMRQIEMMTTAIAKLLCGKDGPAYDLKDDLGQERSSELQQKLTALLREGKLGEAENLLFFELARKIKAYWPWRLIFIGRQTRFQIQNWKHRALHAQSFGRGWVKQWNDTACTFPDFGMNHRR